MRVSSVFSFGDFARDFAADRGKLPFEIAQTGFFGVLGDNAQHGVVGDFQAFERDAVIVKLAGNEILARDLEFFLVGVARKLNYFHAVRQGGRNRIEQIGRANKQHVGEIERQIQIMIAEGVVLFRDPRLPAARPTDRRENRRRLCRSRRA